MITWLQEHFAPPLTRMCVRPASQLATKIPAKTHMDSLHSFYNDNCRVIKTRTVVALTTKDPLRRRFQLLTHMAFFFAMRSCEYLKVSGNRRTQPVRMCDIVFRDHFNRIVPHSDPKLHEAESVLITFRFQKRDIRDDTIKQSRSGNKQGLLSGGSVCSDNQGYTAGRKSADRPGL
jgi:hypothetical protein